MNNEIDDQRPDEEIIFAYHQHPWVLTKTFVYLILVIVLVVLVFLIWQVNQISIGILIVGLIFSVIIVSVRWFSYASDLFILTNQRVIKIDQTGLFNRKVSETELDNVYNVNYEVKGLIRSFLNFGDIKISTVGDEISTITIKNIENPSFIQEKIMSYHSKFKSKLYSS